MIKKVWEGDLIVWGQEGGYAAPDIQIGDSNSVTGDIEDIARDAGYSPNFSDLHVNGKWRLTLERIDE